MIISNLNNAKKLEIYVSDIKLSSRNSLFIINGVITSSHSDSDIKKIVESSENNNHISLRQIRGSYNFLSYKKGKLQLISDFFSSKPIFYYQLNGSFACSFNLWELIKHIKEMKININLDRNSIFQMLTYGFMLDDNTIIKEIKSITPSTIYSFDFLDFLSERTIYFEFDYSPFKNNKTKEHLSKVHNLFNNAIDTNFNKDLQMNKEHFTMLSGGLDSRLLNIASKVKGYSNVTNFTLGESNSQDLKFATKVNRTINYSHHIQLLDSGQSLLNYYDVIRLNYGLVSYLGTALARDGFKSINFDKFGIIHSGNLGDVIFSKWSKNNIIDKHIGYTSSKLLDMLEEPLYQNQNKFLLRTRGINSNIRADLGVSDFGNSLSPFLDIDLLQYCIKIPYKVLKNHNFYRKYIKKFYKKYYNIPTTRYYGASLKSNGLLKLLHKIIYFGPLKIINIVLYKFGIIKKPISIAHGKGMSPIEIWYEKKEIQSQLNGFFHDNFYLISDALNSKKISERVFDLYEFGNVTEKTLVISLIQSLKILNEL